MVIFDKDKHSYTWHKEEQEIDMISVSGFFSHFKEPFDSAHISARKVCNEIDSKKYKDFLTSTLGNEREAVGKFILSLDQKSSDDFLMRQMNYVKTWKKTGTDAADEGTFHHSEFEKRDYERGWALNSYNQKKYRVQQNPFHHLYDNCTIKDNLFELEDGYYPELLLPYYEGLITGTSDKVFIETTSTGRYVDIDDYKFVGELLKKSKFFDKEKKKFPTFKYPIDHLNACNFYEYEIKISMYGWILEQFGFKVRSLKLSHMKKLELPGGIEHLEIQHDLQYRKKEIEMMVDFYQNIEKKVA